MRDNKDHSVWLNDIMESIDLIRLYLGDLTEEEFFNSSEKQDAVARRLGIIGGSGQKFIRRFQKTVFEDRMEGGRRNEKYFNTRILRYRPRPDLEKP